MPEDKRTEISAMGEFRLIDRLTAGFENRLASSVVGIGDDAAVIDAGAKYTLLSTDMLLEGVHFDLTYTPLKHLGYKAISINVSDIAAMNGIPEQVTVNIAVSNRFAVEALDHLYDGVRAACEDYNVDLVGGDTTSSVSGLVISVSITGVVDKERLALRSTARNHDIVCVTGDLGGAYVGLQVLEREKQEFLANPDMQPSLDKYKYIVERQLKPIARTDIVHELAEMDVRPGCMIDISDGLASELHHLSTRSGVGFRLYEDKLPIDKQTYDTAVEFGLDPVTCALNGGEDYELLFTISRDQFESLKNHADIHFIGHAVEMKNIELTTKSGNVIPVKAQGWDHFGQ